MIREWIVFALCLGLGGHIALGVVLHSPERWPWSHAGLYGLVMGVAVYLAVQLVRAVWWAVRGRSKSDSLDDYGHDRRF
jgi:hypothetical protein